jgi:acid phosphatase type 7
MTARLTFRGLLLCLAFPQWISGQVLVFDHTNFASLAGLGLQGSANQAGASLRVTTAAPAQSGAVGHGRRVFVAGGFETVFQFQITGRAGGPANSGGEGFALVIQNNALPALGPSGEGLGYAGVPASLAVEFDVSQNASLNDPNANHVSIHTRRSLPNNADHSDALAAVTNGLPDLADGNIHTAGILYEGTNLVVFVDDLATPVLSMALPPGEEGQEGSLAELLGLDDGQAWIGFTATTSDAVENVDLLNWSCTLRPSPLQVSLVDPGEGASYLCPARIDMEASVLSTGAVTRVEFYQGTIRLGESTTAPWQFAWKDVIPGTYFLTAVAIDETGRMVASLPVKVVVYPALPPIGINFSTGAADADYPLGLTDPAGVVEQRIWNNLTSPTSGNGSANNLRDGGGAVTPIDVFWDFVRPTEDSSVNASRSGDYALMKTGLIDDRGASGGQTNSVIRVVQVPYPIYDLVVYSDSANGLANCVAEFRLATNSAVFLRDGPGASFGGGFAEATGASDQGAGTPDGNFVRFRSLTSSSFTLTVTAGSSSDGIPRATVNAIQIVPSLNAAPPQITRGPYLQIGTPTSMTVRWRTSRPADTRVLYGLSLAALTATNDDLILTTEHLVTLTNLQPHTRYYYAIGTTETNLAAGFDYNFVTSPTSPVPTRIWFVSDYGFKNSSERTVRDSYFRFADETKPADVWITGGDNDQTDGRDSNYQLAVFGTDYGYGNLLRNHPLWPTMGNHDYQTAQAQAYYANFSMPTNAEAGGVPSGTEHYYSFNYGDIHFVNLDSVVGSMSDSTNTPMFQWLRADLANATQRWVIAYWHGTPYTKGSHDSDNDSDTLAWMGQMRQNALPILESYGVDLVLCGHSHVYERSWMLQGHYGYSNTFNETNKIDGGDGRVDGTGAYLKSVRSPGTVYVTAAVGGQPQSNTSEMHPAHLLKISGTLGSLVIDVNANRLDFQFINTDAVTLDYFTLSKEPPSDPPAAPTGLAAADIEGNRIQLVWDNTPTDEMEFLVERSFDGANFTPLASVGANLTRYIDSSPPPGIPCFYRVRAWNTTGSSDYSIVASARVPVPLRITRLHPSGSSLTLVWQSVPGQTYDIQRTDDVGTPAWQAVLEGIIATDYSTSGEVALDLDKPVGFYRIQARGN